MSDIHSIAIISSEGLHIIPKELKGKIVHYTPSPPLLPYDKQKIMQKIILAPGKIEVNLHIPLTGHFLIVLLDGTRIEGPMENGKLCGYGHIKTIYRDQIEGKFETGLLKDGMHITPNGTCLLI